LKRYKVMIYCDQELTQLLIKRFLEEHDFEIITASSRIWDIVAQAQSHELHGILVEARRNSLNGLKELSIIKAEFPKLPVTILSASTEAGDVIKALNMGANGYLLKNTIADDFIKDFASVCDGNLCVSRELMGTVLKNVRGSGMWKDASSSPKLTPREQEILALMVCGESNREIAEHTVLSINTVNNHVASIYRKLGTHKRVSAVTLWEKSFHGDALE
jgi:DNA-binding NarL/FixJ family response regulator